MLCRQRPAAISFFGLQGFDCCSDKHPFVGSKVVIAVQTSTLDLVPGQEFTGTIRKIMLHHGALVDIGAQHDA